MKYRIPILMLTVFTSTALVMNSWRSPGEAEETVDEFVALIEQAALEEGIDPDEVVLVPPPSADLDEEAYIATLGEWISANLRALGSDMELHSIETFGIGDTHEAMGRQIFFSNHGQELPARFVPGDQRRVGWSGPSDADHDNITSIIDDTQGATSSGLTPLQTTTAITKAMQTWNTVPSGRIPINQSGPFGPVTSPFVPLPPFYSGDIGFTQFLLGIGGLPVTAADIQHCGFLPEQEFNILAGPAGPNVLAVAFVYRWLTDIDNDGYLDTATCEIYYNDRFDWDIDNDDFPYSATYDVQTTALHEAGHALSLPHFGQGFRTLKNGKIHYAPRCVMNASYTGQLQELTGREIGFFDSIWATWPLE